MGELYENPLFYHLNNELCCMRHLHQGMLLIVYSGYYVFIWPAKTVSQNFLFVSCHNISHLSILSTEPQNFKCISGPWDTLPKLWRKKNKSKLNLRMIEILVKADFTSQIFPLLSSTWLWDNNYAQSLTGALTLLMLSHTFSKNIKCKPT